MMFRSAAATAILFASAAAVQAADAPAAIYATSPQPPATAMADYGAGDPYNGADLVFELGVSAEMSPDYDGSDDYEVLPSVIGSIEYLNIPGLGSFGGPDGLGFSIGPSFDYVGERDSSDIDDLDGLDDVDETYQAGIRVGYEWENAEIYGEARYAFGGAEGFVGEAGANLIARPTERLTLKAGPFTELASSEYLDAYFGVDSDEALRTGFDEFDPDGGFKSVGARATVKYEVFTDWFVNAEGSYERLVGDAADSPVVDAAGSKDQYSLQLGVSKRFSLDLF